MRYILYSPGSSQMYSRTESSSRVPVIAVMSTMPELFLSIYCQLMYLSTPPTFLVMHIQGRLLLAVESPLVLYATGIDSPLVNTVLGKESVAFFEPLVNVDVNPRFTSNPSWGSFQLCVVQLLRALVLQWR